MGIKIHVVTDEGFKRFMFECPACRCCHGPTDKWKFNGDLEKPTFSPSILVRWSKTDPQTGLLVKDMVCHSFVENGMIRFLDDCTHELAGKTVEIPDFD